MLKEFEKLVAKGYINKGQHPIFPLYVWDYSRSCAYDGHWNKHTLIARGLITDKNFNIVSRPLPKFFNLEELPKWKNHIWHWYKMKYKELWTRPFIVQEKMDGSMGISYFYNGEWAIATRGSFKSDQALHATKVLNTKYKHLLKKLNPDYTYIFEIIYKSNRIVVNYGDMDDLVLLTIIETSTGKEFDTDLPFKKPKVYDYKTVDELRQHQDENFEGFVLRYDNGVRCKVKLEEYCRLHKVMTGITDKVILDKLSENHDFDEWLKDVPEEFRDEIETVVEKFQIEFGIIVSDAKEEFHKLQQLKLNRKDFAELAYKSDYTAILFKLLDKTDYSEIVWNMVKENEKKERIKCEVI